MCLRLLNFYDPQFSNQDPRHSSFKTRTHDPQFSNQIDVVNVVMFKYLIDISVIVPDSYTSPGFLYYIQISIFLQDFCVCIFRISRIQCFGPVSVVSGFVHYKYYQLHSYPGNSAFLVSYKNQRFLAWSTMHWSHSRWKSLLNWHDL